MTCSNHYVWCCHILLESPCKEDFKNWKKGWLFPPTSCCAQKLVPSLKMAKNGCSLSMFVSCTIEKPVKRDFEKSKKNVHPTHFLPNLKIDSRSKNEQHWLFSKYCCVICHWKAHGKEISKWPILASCASNTEELSWAQCYELVTILIFGPKVCLLIE